MSHCPVCSTPLPAEGRFCPGCGSEISISSTPTLRAGSDDPAVKGNPGPAATGARSGPADLLPGTMVSGRYRIASILGRGGMGEVYRADDLKLGEPVALKFLPARLAADSEMVKRFQEEVRIARRVSHPNICTVHDIGEVEGVPYLSMEYVDGEDLASLQRRAGQLSRTKAAEVGRQICAGLAAAHAKGVIHRDLKPTNILIDSQGHARISDFGLAAASSVVTGRDARSGTPAYMSPEQLAGEAVTAASDIYALGLLLYELFSGRKPFQGGTLTERLKSRSAPSAAEVAGGSPEFPPEVAAMVARCLAPDPNLRPTSALAVAARLPGTDLLSASLEAGETPSPELVAAAGSSGSLQPWQAIACLLVTISGCATLAAFSDSLYLFRRASLPNSAQVLSAGAQDLLADLGFEQSPGDSASGLEYRRGYLQHLRSNVDTPDKWDRAASGRPAVIGFWYRQSPARMVPGNIDRSISPTDPPLTRPGMVLLKLDPEGRVLSFIRVPEEGLTAEAGEADWDPLLIRAGLDPAMLTPTTPIRTPPVYADRRAAWEGALGDAGAPMRVEAASAGGRPVFFELFEPWDLHVVASPPAAALSRNLQVSTGFLSLLTLGLILGTAVWMARRNIRRGRGDQKGALRVAVVAFTGLTTSLLLEADHLPTTTAEWGLAGPGPLAVAVPLALAVWVLYVAIEPYVRRLWPRTLISWERLLHGEWRDPMIGRDILAGGVMAALSTFGFLAIHAESGWQLPPLTPALGPLVSAADAASLFLDVVTFSAPFNPLVFMFVLLLLRFFIKRRLLSLIAAGTLISAVGLAGQAFSSPGSVTPLVVVIQLAGVALLLAILVRFGILAIMVASAFQSTLLLYPASIEPGAWYGPTALVPYLFIVGLSVYGAFTSLAGTEIFSMRALETEG